MGEINVPAKDEDYFYCTDFLHFFRSVFRVCTPSMIDTWCSTAGVPRAVLDKILKASSAQEVDVKFGDLYALFAKNPFIDSGISLRFKPVQQWESFWSEDHSWYFNEER